MVKKDQIFFVIPAYNEGTVLVSVLKNLQKEGYKNLIVIDDGSTDNTQENMQPLNIIYLKHVVNRGQGAALQTGIEYAKNQDKCKYIVTFDSDGQHRIADLPHMLPLLEKNECDIVLGSRFLKKSSRKLVPLKKKILLKGALIITYFFSPIHLTDTHNGYRVMNKRAANQINITMDGFEHASEIIDEIAKHKIRYKEAPVTIDYTEYAKQKGQRISNSIKILIKMLLRG
ncbi:MAG: glycosyltransferase involved in cell wall biosynthesis [Candidatus Woesearchaeota archaeon]|jgi:glycosyltransferase involved in cell wall biosynthesis